MKIIYFVFIGVIGWAGTAQAQDVVLETRETKIHVHEINQINDNPYEYENHFWSNDAEKHPQQAEALAKAQQDFSRTLCAIKLTVLGEKLVQNQNVRNLANGLLNEEQRFYPNISITGSMVLETAANPQSLLSYKGHYAHLTLTSLSNPEARFSVMVPVTPSRDCDVAELKRLFMAELQNKNQQFQGTDENIIRLEPVAEASGI